MVDAPDREYVSLRLDPAVDGDVRAAERVAGCPLPRAVGEVAAGRGGHVLALGPDEWLLAGDPAGRRGLQARLRRALADRPHLAVDLTAGLMGTTLAPERARALLPQGCPLDLHESAFGPGRCARTLLAGMTVTLWRPPADGAFVVLVTRSYGAHLRAWLQDAAA